MNNYNILELIVFFKKTKFRNAITLQIVTSTTYATHNKTLYE